VLCNVASFVPGLLPTFPGTEKPALGLEKGNGQSGSLQELTVTELVLWFSKVMVAPLAPFHPLLHTFFLSLIDLPFRLRSLGTVSQHEATMEPQLFGG
jgi:hypothetical protein